MNLSAKQSPSELEIERTFHDEAAEDIDVRSIPILETFEGPTSPEPRYIARLFGDVRGKRILDLGCGAGEASVYFAKRGAHVVALDLSQGMCDVTNKLAEFHQVADRVETVCAAAEEAGIPDSSFDYIYGYGVLHHVDISKTAVELHRLLKPGGKAAFIEPLEYNPAINVYRRLAEGVRTPTEHPIRKSDIKDLERAFTRVRHREFQLMTLAVFVWMYFVERLNPSEVRYWKRIISEADRYARAYRLLEAVDRVLLSIAPPLRWWCWTTVIVCER